jgi:hypothetical protein
MTYQRDTLCGTTGVVKFFIPKAIHHKKYYILHNFLNKTSGQTWG